MDKYLKAPLSQAQAKSRAQLFAPTKDNIKYQLFLKIKKGDSFEGQVKIIYDLQKISQDLFFEFSGTDIHEITINDKKIPTSDNYESLRDRRFLKLPIDHQVVGKNELVIKYSNLYANDGLGLHSFIDTDGKQYLYSLSCAYAANKIFPCFDQPDLKANLDLVMVVPDDWVAIANQSIINESPLRAEILSVLTEDDLKRNRLWAFKTTPRLSTYLFAFVAGPFKEIKAKNIHRSIAMSCYCRESLMQYMESQAEEFFEVTRECLKFYEEFFNYQYPFEKYDSVFCPEFKYGAMENPGLVEFADRLIWREKVTQDRNTARVITITHEASHQWFGNLVTMNWWNDLWLNESFAEFISHYCLYNIKDKITTTKLSDTWLSFFNRKEWGYDTDQKITTHPIAGEIQNTDQAETIFDGITYSKGAASLKQLMKLIGEENFGKAMSSYFKTYEWSNTTLNDFIGKLQEFYLPKFPGSPSNLNEWKSEWLQTAGLNECELVWNPNDQTKEAKLVIKQGVALEMFPTLRHHKMKIAFFGENGDIIAEKDIMLNNTKETVITYDGSLGVKAVKLNYQDETFIKVRLDEHSISFFRKKLNSVPDQLTRAMIWRSLFEMVKDGKLSAVKFAEIALEALPSETCDSTLSKILGSVLESFQYCPSVLNENIIKPKLFDCTLKMLLETDKNAANRIVLLRENLIQFASFGKEKNIDNIARLRDWLDERDPELKDIALEVKDKWSIVTKIHNYSKLGDNEKANYFNKVADIDKSDRMKLVEQRCEALRADHVLRKKLFESYLDPENKLSVQVIQESMFGYNHSQKNTHEDEELFFNSVTKVFQTRSNEYAKKFYDALFPVRENFVYYVESANKVLEQAGENDLLKKCLRESLDFLEKKKKGYMCSAADLMKEFFNISY